MYSLFLLFSSRRRHTVYWRDWSSDVCSSDLVADQNQASARVVDVAAQVLDDAPSVAHAARGHDHTWPGLLGQVVTLLRRADIRSAGRRVGKEGRSWR